MAWVTVFINPNVSSGALCEKTKAFGFLALAALRCGVVLPQMQTGGRAVTLGAGVWLACPGHSIYSGAAFPFSINRASLPWVPSPVSTG